MSKCRRLYRTLSNEDPVTYPRAESHAAIEADKLPKALGREAAFVQLFQNLIANAIKYRRPDVPPLIRITSGVHDGVARICVRDNGIGIAPEYHKQIFGVFRRLHGAEIPGTGIGLAICQRTWWSAQAAGCGWNPRPTAARSSG